SLAPTGPLKPSSSHHGPLILLTAWLTADLDNPGCRYTGQPLPPREQACPATTDRPGRPNLATDQMARIRASELEGRRHLFGEERELAGFVGDRPQQYALEPGRLERGQKVGEGPG